MGVLFDFSKCFSRSMFFIFVFVVALAFVFFLLLTLKIVDYSFVPSIKTITQSTSESMARGFDPFQTYRDFVTTTTGLLTLIIGAIGIGSFISFRKFKEEEAKITDRRNQLDMFLKIEEGRNISESEATYSTAIKLYDEAERLHSKYHMLYTLRGEAYYYRNRTGDLQNAIKDFEVAIELKKNSSRAWFGLGQARFRLVRRKHCNINNLERHLENEDVADLKIADNEGVIDRKKETREAMEDIEKAISFQYAEAPARLELGKMYKSIGDNKGALKQYKLAYESNKAHAACGFTYALLWLSENDDCLEKAKEEGILDIIRKASVYDVYNSKAAYALLWYLYSKVPELGGAEKAKSMTDSLVINELFELRETV
ncbi:tetratricopeptide repeat protein [Desulfovibrio oxyclinae]|uniref:tetratricopeptide repeat protein n=1 Tax=Desulfovibrio oxyclinae TaxID=63560 RepID=UPI00036C34B6|nr:hypothetical protein [Desulfovibrio oxyclinae]